LDAGGAPSVWKVLPNATPSAVTPWRRTRPVSMPSSVGRMRTAGSIAAPTRHDVFAETRRAGIAGPCQRLSGAAGLAPVHLRQPRGSPRRVGCEGDKSSAQPHRRATVPGVRTLLDRTQPARGRHPAERRQGARFPVPPADCTSLSASGVRVSAVANPVPFVERHRRETSRRSTPRPSAGLEPSPWTMPGPPPSRVHKHRAHPCW
jgi:hypothetical protein